MLFCGGNFKSLLLYKCLQGLYPRGNKNQEVYWITIWCKNIYLTYWYKREEALRIIAKACSIRDSFAITKIMISLWNSRTQKNPWIDYSFSFERNSIPQMHGQVNEIHCIRYIFYVIIYNCPHMHGSIQLFRSCDVKHLLKYQLEATITHQKIIRLDKLYITDVITECN